MLIAFRAENFKCFSQEVSYSLLANEESNNTTYLGSAPISNQLSITGAPSTGKTSSLEILKFIKEAVTLGSVDQFSQVSSAKTDDDTVVEIVISVDNLLYSYGFSFNQKNNLITGEWINELQANGHSTMLYSRDDENFSLTYQSPITKEDHKFFDIYKNDIKSNQLGLTLLATHNYDNAPSLKFFSAIKDFLQNSIIEIFPRDQIILTNNTLAAPELCDLSNILNKLDTGISAVSLEKTSACCLSKHQLRRLNKSALSVCIRTQDRLIFADKKQASTELFEIKFCHGVGKRRFTLNFGDESSSNQRLIELALLAMNTCESNTLFLLDNLDQNISQSQANAIIDIICDKTNEDKQQLIFAASDLFLPNEDIFSQEQCWNTYRNRYGECYAIQNECYDDEEDEIDNDGNYNDDYNQDVDDSNDYNNDIEENKVLAERYTSEENVVEEHNESYEENNVEKEDLASNTNSSDSFVSTSENQKIIEEKESIPLAYEMQNNETKDNISTSEEIQENTSITEDKTTKEADEKQKRKVRLTVKQVKEIIGTWSNIDAHAQNAIYIHIRNHRIDVTTLDTQEKINQTFIDMYDILLEKEKRKKYSKKYEEFCTMRDVYASHINEQVSAEMLNSALSIAKEAKLVAKEQEIINQIQDDLQNETNKSSETKVAETEVVVPTINEPQQEDKEEQKRSLE